MELISATDMQLNDSEIYTVMNTDNHDVIYMTEDGITGLRQRIKPGWYIDTKVDGIATSKYTDMVFKIPDGGVAKVYQGGSVNIVNAPFSGWGSINPINSPMPCGWKRMSYFENLDRFLPGDGTIAKTWQSLFNLAGQIR